jgi:hypothetical protein
MAIQSYRDLDAYKRARNSIVPVHELIERLPSEIVQPIIDEYTVVAKQFNKLIQKWCSLSAKRSHSNIQNLTSNFQETTCPSNPTAGFAKWRTSTA